MASGRPPRGATNEIAHCVDKTKVSGMDKVPLKRGYKTGNSWEKDLMEHNDWPTLAATSSTFIQGGNDGEDRDRGDEYEGGLRQNHNETSLYLPAHLKVNDILYMSTSITSAQFNSKGLPENLQAAREPQLCGRGVYKTSYTIGLARAFLSPHAAAQIQSGGQNIPSDRHISMCTKGPTIPARAERSQAQISDCI